MNFGRRPRSPGISLAAIVPLLLATALLRAGLRTIDAPETGASIVLDGEGRLLRDGRPIDGESLRAAVAEGTPALAVERRSRGAPVNASLGLLKEAGADRVIVREAGDGEAPR